MGSESKGRRLKKCVRLALYQHAESCHSQWWSLFPSPLTVLFICLSSLSNRTFKKSPSWQVIYTQCDNMWSCWSHILEGDLGLPSRNSGVPERRWVGAELQEYQKGEEWDIPLKEAIRSCIQCNALLLGFSWPPKGDPLVGQAERSFLLLWPTGLAYTELLFHLKILEETFHCCSE